jgi:antitoxin component YwqK of YwqJK toxin-antitoxin module
MRYLAFYILLLAFSCARKVETIETKNEFGYTIKYSRSKTDFAKQGAYTSFYPTGIKYEEANYINDTLHGERKLYFESGALEVLENYNMGSFISPYKRFFENGKVQQEGSYENNVATGEWKKYYQNGQLEESVTLDNNEENGPFQEFYENGNLKAEGAYKGFDEDSSRPREHGLLKLYNEEGILIKKMNCNLGICRTIWTLEEGDVKQD